jgi:hypothetical protein
MEKLKTTNIKGKDYVEVHERIRYFRKHFEGWILTTEIVELNDKHCILKALISNPDGTCVATGLAREVNGDGYINKTSYVENCETSAWGRALGNLGIGIDTSVSSADEVGNAIEQQKTKKESKKHTKQGDDSPEPPHPPATSITNKDQFVAYVVERAEVDKFDIKHNKEYKGVWDLLVSRLADIVAAGCDILKPEDVNIRMKPEDNNWLEMVKVLKADQRNLQEIING